MHLLNLHECNYSQGEAIALWAEIIKDIRYRYTSWLFKGGGDLECEIDITWIW